MSRLSCVLLGALGLAGVAARAAQEPPAPAAAKPSYSLEARPVLGSELQRRFTPDRLALLEKLNVDADWYMPWYFSFDNDRGLALHQFTLPGRPASHACVRLLERDARWLYDWGEGWTLDKRGWEVLVTGTPVWILGSYDFDAPPPWRSIDWLARGIELGEGP